jgi:hypothetical protein
MACGFSPRLLWGAGYLSGYAVFTAALFLLLGLASRLPGHWGIADVAALTAAATACSAAFRRWLL